MSNKGNEKNLTPLEIAEKYVDWAAERGISADSTYKAINAWRHFNLTKEERGYIKHLAKRTCKSRFPHRIK